MAGMVCFHVFVAAVHAIGGVVTLVAGLACRVGEGQQVPIAEYRPRGGPSLADFCDGAGLAPDLGVPLLALNPYLLIMAFEWITAAFALLYLREASPGLVPLAAAAWLLLGACLQALWIALTLDYPCPLQSAVVVALFLYAARVCAYPYRRLQPGGAREQVHRSEGREWHVPSMDRLKHARQPDHAHAEEEDIMGRYDEYAITAPLLFLAVVALYLPGAPVWLVLSGYFLIAACNVWGPPVHLLSLEHWRAQEGHAVTWWDALRALLCMGAWRARPAQRLAAFWLAWMSLLLPFGGLLYLTRALWFEASLPALVLVLSWNLLVTYCLFGLVPSVMYLTNWGRSRLALALDVLNLAAKGPLPWMLLYGFFGRPAGFVPCRAG